MAGSMIPPWLIEQSRWRREMEALSPVSGEDDSTTEEEEEEEEGEGRCQKKLGEAKALSKPALCTNHLMIEHADKL